MRKFTAIIAVVMMFVGATAHAQVKVAERAVAWSSAARAGELLRAMNLTGVKANELGSKVQAFVATQTPLAKAYAQQAIIFSSLRGSGKSVDQAFELAFVKNGKVLSATNVAAFSTASAQQSKQVANNVLSNNAQQNLSCQATPASYLQGSDLASFRSALRNTTALTGVNMLGSSTASCANWDKDMAKGFAQIVIETDKVLKETNSRDVKYALGVAYGRLMGTDATQTAANLNTLAKDCQISFGL